MTDKPVTAKECVYQFCESVAMIQCVPSDQDRRDIATAVLQLVREAENAAWNEAMEAAALDLEDCKLPSAAKNVRALKREKT